MVCGRLGCKRRLSESRVNVRISRSWLGLWSVTQTFVAQMVCLPNIWRLFLSSVAYAFYFTRIVSCDCGTSSSVVLFRPSYFLFWLVFCLIGWLPVYRVSNTPGNHGNVLELFFRPGNPGNLLGIYEVSWKFSGLVCKFACLSLTLVTILVFQSVSVQNVSQ